MAARREDRFCAKCKHCYINAELGGMTLHVCNRPRLIDLVTGQQRAMDCQIERNSSDSHRCGPSGWFFEAKDDVAAA